MDNYAKKLEMITSIMDSIDAYAEKHPLAVEAGADYVYQNDKAQVDALNLVADIFEKYSKYHSPNKEEEEE